MRKLLVVVFFTTILTQLTAQTTPDSSWTRGGSYNFNFARVGLQNWAGGGQSSISLTNGLNFFLNYEGKKASWNNTADLAFGLARVGRKETSFKKSDDQIIVTSKYSYKLKHNFNFTGLIDFRSQFAPGYVYEPDTLVPGNEISARISDFMAPAYLLTSIGIEYKKGKKFYLLFSPITCKTTFVMDQTLADAGAFGVDPGKNYRLELGTLVKSGLNFQIMDNVTFSSNLILFSAYNTYGNVDVNWETVTKFKINDYLTATYSTLLVYDDDITVIRSRDEKPTIAVQFKDVLNIGLLYNFGEKIKK